MTRKSRKARPIPLTPNAKIKLDEILEAIEAYKDDAVFNLPHNSRANYDQVNKFREKIVGEVNQHKDDLKKADSGIKDNSPAMKQIDSALGRVLQKTHRGSSASKAKRDDRRSPSPRSVIEDVSNPVSADTLKPAVDTSVDERRTLIHKHLS